MTPTIPTNATRVEPVYGWAAVAPDGVLATFCIHLTENSCWQGIAQHLCFPGYAYAAGAGTAAVAGWRVIRVQISPAGEREEADRGNG